MYAYIRRIQCKNVALEKLDIQANHYMAMAMHADTTLTKMPVTQLKRMTDCKTLA